MTATQRDAAAPAPAPDPANDNIAAAAADSWWQTAAYDYVLPPELIAQHPNPERGGSRLLHVRQDGLADLAFRQLPELVAPGDVMVFNDTRVLKSRLFGRKPSGGRVELLLERVLGQLTARFQLRASHPPHAGGRIDLPGGAHATVLARDGRFVDLELAGATTVVDYLGRFGSTPLPPYIARPAGAEDDERYQTVYARTPGAVAAPTAGLHFEASTLAALDARGVTRLFVTLHVGSGTFAPVGTDDLRTHRMHSEWFDIPADTATAIAAARARGARVMAVGTTSMRALEAAGLADGTVTAGAAETSIFIHPGYRFRVVDRLLTNFHLPRSTLLMLVSAFAGVRTMRAAYAHAIAARYRFFSYGDASLLERADAPPDAARAAV